MQTAVTIESMQGGVPPCSHIHVERYFDAIL